MWIWLSLSAAVLGAIGITSIALAQSVERSQLLITLLLGIVFLKDHPTKHIWIASLLLIFGVIIIKISTEY
ncbi:MAG: hypothetical protein M3P33_01115 [bacterium]|nr:hypothetical protein [bacterium]